MKKPIPFLLICIISTFNTVAQNSNSDIKEYANYGFLPGEKTIFEDNLFNDKIAAAPLSWKTEGGEAKVEDDNNIKCISIKQYYTKLSPKLTVAKLPEEFSIEYDTWMDAGYDGNPGIEIHLLSTADEEALITPNRDQVYCRYPGGETNKETPEAIRGENFYNKWNHVAIVYSKKSLTVYVNQFHMFTIPDCKINSPKLIVSGNASQEMKMFFKNFRIAKDIPNSVGKDLAKGLLVTHAIKFDVNKSELKPESMSVLNEVAKFLKANAAVRLEINGHTDTDGNDNSNLILSQQRADAIKVQLIKMGIESSRLTAKGYGETKALDVNTTSEGKANNRRVEFKSL